jgi:two-component system invasion response regulator UvrY
MIPCILLADDHAMIRKGLLATLETNFGYRDISAVGSCAGIMRELRNKAYTHLILDINFGSQSSVEILEGVTMLYPHLRIAILTMLPAVSLRKIAKAYSIRFIISKEETEEEMNRKLTYFLHNRVPAKSDLDWEMENPFADLSTREMEVLHYWLKGLKNIEIAVQLELSPQTVSTFKRRIKDKTHTDNDKELEILATAFGINV